MVAAALAALALAAKAPPPHRFLAVDRRTHTAVITLIASYDGANNGFNYDGYSRVLMWTVPRGWHIRVVCENRGALRHSCAVVHGAGTTKLAFPHASTPYPTIGLKEGERARFTFRASRDGVFRFACLVYPYSGLYDVLKIVKGGRPSVVDLQAR
ncbi:MAG TPA: sulfocyanin-like copper-binding protein [Gaiellaceae bacterium]|nr:sulfocyanin-like copper-binding protein [Gaiellaceae bacterium]